MLAQKTVIFAPPPTSSTPSFFFDTLPREMKKKFRKKKRKERNICLDCRALSEAESKPRKVTCFNATQNQGESSTNCLSHLTLALARAHIDPDGEIKTPSPEPLTKQIH